MSDTIIKVEGIGKKYRIRHKQPERYSALRDVISERVWRVLRPQKSGTASAPAIEDFWALKDVSFEVKRGEVIGIIGRNGAGKSTLLKILSRITEPTEGYVDIDGHVASLLEVGTGFHPELTGRENIYLNGAILGMSRVEIKRKFDEIVTFAEIDKFLDTPVKRYSSGMYVRLAFAVAAHLEPEILIVDEVLAVGDLEFQKKCLGTMRDVSRAGRTVIFVSHNMAAVRALCTNGLFLKDGSVQLKGTIEHITDAYLSNSMNDAVGLTFPSSNIGKPQFKSITCDKSRYSYGAKIQFDFELLSPQTTKVAIDFEMHDERGMPIMYSSTAPMYGELLELRANCATRTTVEIGPLPLASGEYSVYFWLTNPWVENYHFAEQPLRFSVDISDPGGVGFDFKQAYGRGAMTIPMRVLR
jgi:lipopolysaccharide transport system ATP-binding protein